MLLGALGWVGRGFGLSSCVSQKHGLSVAKRVLFDLVDLLALFI